MAASLPCSVRAPLDVGVSDWCGIGASVALSMQNFDSGLSLGLTSRTAPRCKQTFSRQPKAPGGDDNAFTGSLDRAYKLFGDTFFEPRNPLAAHGRLPR